MMNSVAKRLVLRAHAVVSRSALSGTARAVLRDRLTYLSPMKLRRLETSLGDILKREVPGDVVEFGVALGGTAIILAEQAKRASRTFQGFDVFGMIPPPTSEKDDTHSKERYETIVSGQSKGIGGDRYYGYRTDLYGDVCRSLARYGVPPDGRSVILHKGLFEDELPKAPLRQVAFAHIDCDWFDPVAYCLRETASRLSPGGVIVIDDYNDYGGCRTATDEFLASHPNFIFENGSNAILRLRG
jgi:O-methyltransferase